MYTTNPAVPFTRMDAGKKIFEFLEQLELGHPYEGGVVLVNKVAFEWAFGVLFRYHQARIIPFRLHVTDKTEYSDDHSTEFYKQDSIRIFNKKKGCHLMLVSE